MEDDDVELPPEAALEIIEDAVALLPESERADARFELLNVLAKNHDAAQVPYPRWLTRRLDRTSRRRHK
ncbi:MAG TPA: hypothetical protein VGR37_23915 [Longimicrobiaceae bacterium]|nr:hypothetical protein [Longimicrobiaceae bacterium]